MKEDRDKDIALENVLFNRIAKEILKKGPLTLEKYFNLVLNDPECGYYQKKDPFGVAGDFVTAPEISGLFGEMCGLYLSHISELSRLNYPAILELGPGRGTLMADMRYVWQRVMPSLKEAPVHLVETSPRLRLIQKAELADANIFWHDNLDDLPPQPIFGLANEFFDALPVAQAIWRQRDYGSAGLWRQRLIDLIDGRLDFIDGPPLTIVELKNWNLNSQKYSEQNNLPDDGTIVEYCPLASTYIGKLAGHLIRYGGMFLIIDYGHDGQSGDSVQAVSKHKPVDKFSQPGCADLSHSVDFHAIRNAAKAAGARLVGPVPQGEFLRSIGILERTEALAKQADIKTRRKLLAAVERLVSNQQMGSIFKFALLIPPGNGAPLGFSRISNKIEESLL